MKIEFEIIDKQNVSVIGVHGNGTRTIIGKIFTPSGSGLHNINAIQVCGFKEAFDLWGCGRFAHPKFKNEIEYAKNKRGEKIFEYSKDIQLMFDDESQDAKIMGNDWPNNCTGCYNNPCTCERKEKYDNPYTVKREQDLTMIERENGDKTRTKIRMLDGLEDEK
jgi:hypothetical protein